MRHPVETGAGAAANLFSGGMHNDYHASESTVEIVNGLLGGVVSAIGCLAGGFLGTPGMSASPSLVSVEKTTGATSRVIASRPPLNTSRSPTPITAWPRSAC